MADMASMTTPPAPTRTARAAAARVVEDVDDGVLLLMTDEELRACRVPAFLATYRPATLGSGDPGLHCHGAALATEQLGDALRSEGWDGLVPVLSRFAAPIDARALERMARPGGVRAIDPVRVSERSAAMADVDALLAAGRSWEPVRLLWGFEDEAGRAVVPCLEEGSWRLRGWGAWG